MSTELVGGALLLQEMKATRLVGSMVSGVSEGGGWLQMSFFSEQGVLTFRRDHGRVRADMNRAIAMVLIASLRVLLAQVRWLRHGEADLGASGGQPLASSSMFQVDREMIAFLCDDDASHLSLAEREGQTEVRMSEQFARDFETALVDALGRLAAGGVLVRAK